MLFTVEIPLAEFILDKSDMDPVVPWEPLVLCGDGVARSDDGVGEGLGPLHTFPHHLMRIWHKQLNVSMMTSDLKGTRVAIDRLTKIRSSMMDLPNVSIFFLFFFCFFFLVFVILQVLNVS